MGMEASTHTKRKIATAAADGEDDKRDSESRGTKRKFELDQEQILQNTKDERAKARKAIDDENVPLPSPYQSPIISTYRTAKTTL